MTGLILYFNELCLHSSFIGNSQYIQTTAASDCLELIINILALRPDCKVAIRGVDRTALAGPIRQFCASSRDKYRRLLMSLIDIADVGPGFLSEVHYMDVSAHGMTMADIVARDWQHGWVIGLSSGTDRWISPEIGAARYTLKDDGSLHGPTGCTISHISRSEHIAYWRQALLDWGETVSSSSRLGDIAGHPIAMYSAPREHNPPHIHLLESSSSCRTLAKYRIDTFARAYGPPTWDVPVREWVLRHQAQLLASWQRCQTGGKPYSISP